MTTGSKQVKKSMKKFQSLQDQQLKSVKRVSGLLSNLEKNSRKTEKLEIKIAGLEQQLHGLHNPDGQPTAEKARGLRSAYLIINRGSGSFARNVESPEKLVDMLSAHGIQVEVHLKTSTKEVRKWVRAAVDKKVPLVIAVGGDGTVEDVAYMLVGSRTALGIIPTGSMNNLARALGIPMDIEQACALLGTGIIRQIDVGSVRSAGKSKRTYFLETAGLGLAIALPVGQNIKKGRVGRLPDAFKKLFDPNAPPAQIRLDNGKKIETKVKLVTVSNAPLTALNNLIAPDAKMDDGLLDLAIYDRMNDLELAEYFLSTANGKRVSNPNVTFYRTRRVHIRSQQELPVESDKNEIPDADELDFEVIPRALRVIVGHGSGLNWPVDAFQSVPLLSGMQVISESNQTVVKVIPTHGEENEANKNPFQQPESPETGAG